MSVNEIALKILNICKKYNLTYAEAIHVIESLYRFKNKIILTEDLEIRDDESCPRQLT